MLNAKTIRSVVGVAAAVTFLGLVPRESFAQG
jgi:hypothetical protein